MLGAHSEVQQLFMSQGGKVFRKGLGFVECTSMELTMW